MSNAPALGSVHGPRAACLKWSGVLVFPGGARRSGVAEEVKEISGSRHTSPAPDPETHDEPGQASQPARPRVIHTTRAHASQLPSCHPAIHPVHQPEGTLIAPPRLALPEADCGQANSAQLVSLLLSAEVSWHYCALTVPWTILPPFHSSNKHTFSYRSPLQNFSPYSLPPPLHYMRCEPFVITYLMWLPCRHVCSSVLSGRGDGLIWTSVTPALLIRRQRIRPLRSGQPNNNNQRHLCVRKLRNRAKEQRLHMELITLGVEAWDRLTDD